jgi:serine/threonine-protein kinase
MPFVEREPLRQRIDRARQLPVDSALEIARQIAGALTLAHLQGVVHRDIKPENIMLSGDAALVTDFGIARAVTAAAGNRLTSTGIAIGTPTYMSPEQASGDEIDGRSDEYSLACVLYEMLTGEPPFAGPTIHAITARKIGHQETSVTLLRESVPAHVGEAIHRALSPVPADRHASVAHFAEALKRHASRETTIDGGGSRTRRARWERPLWAAAGASLALVAAFAAQKVSARDESAGFPSIRMSVTLPGETSVTRGPGYNSSSVALSPDGRTLVIAGSDSGGQRLYNRPLDRLEATSMAGTEGGSSPFFSPDGKWVGFFAGGKLRRIPLEGGGAAIDIAAVENAVFLSGASWGPDDRIVFSNGVSNPLYVTSVSGGDVSQLTHLDSGEAGHKQPHFLPDGRTIVFESAGRIHAVDVSSGRRASLIQGQSPRYAKGRLIFSRGVSVLSVPFDQSGLKITGRAEPLVDGAAGDRDFVSHYAVSSEGTLAYLRGATTHDLVLVDPGGVEQQLVAKSLAHQNPRFSPDGFRIAVATGNTHSERSDIWVHDLQSGAASRLTFDGGRAPVWTPDGGSITYSRLGDHQGIYTKRADGRGEATRLLALDQFHWLVGWTPDARTLLYGMIVNRSESSINALTDGANRIVVGPGSIWGGRLSPDGRWLAYYTMEAGRFQIYVTPFPAARERWLITTEGGRDPSWGPRSDELYYVTSGRLMSARLDLAGGVRVISRRQVADSFAPPLYDDYHVHPDGRTQVHVRPHAESNREVVVVINALGDVDS